MAIGVIGGSGLYEFGESAADATPVRLQTEYGAVQLTQANMHSREVFFLPRHGPDHTIPPHRINFRANIAALNEVACTDILATNAVGSLRPYISPSELVLPDQYIDFTKTRHSTFFDDFSEGTAHIDQTQPYSAALREKAHTAAQKLGLSLHDGAVYLCAEGPRFETPAEIRMFAGWGADLVGMTGVPEIVLANELEIRYLSLCIVTNYAAGISDGRIDHKEVIEIMDSRTDDLRKLITRIIAID